MTLSMLKTLGGLGWVGVFALPLLVATATPARPEVSDTCPRGALALALPSGQDAVLCDIAEEVQPIDGATWLVLRVIMPSLAEADAAEIFTDHTAICADLALEAAAERDPAPARIVSQIIQEPFPRGQASPGIAQSIEVFSIENSTCIWEVF